ncbi:hypothetical protein HanXRQr2_Chr15g0705211 [Helianthus annuus]|uniref:Uncharacterized protein n=1 Tax=Helianthus annuus TaxID=4232 RepID=A0A9K3H5J7_HELAN|nr:uncharacterized protein LOC110911989 [Helianthus annuus]KAF5765564.1 hypothetical protein HanXRQr2_Chr15g0705211 [Helianthus annuus]KAJ0456832.1 hypothetical protein HanIR_Chr15g0766941 [Helianthus annuus]KAJ0653341.1 hypothetical protein HanOQP8_Chr15g0582441 [Helianthus annuus]KAJ0832264.1 hypothetical protein HanPSC8_Chr15g0676771 [Helianthus annuus]
MEITLPNYTTGRYDRNHLLCEGKILQNISLENIMVRLGNRGKLRMWDLRILHAVLVGTPKLSWRHITMMNISDTRNQYKRKMIPCVRLISAMIFQQNRLKDNSLWILKGIDTIDFAQLRSGVNIYAEVLNKKAKLVDRKTGFQFEYVQRNEDEEMGEGDGGDGEEEEAGEEEDRGRRPPRQRYARRHNESSHTVAQFINNRRRVAYASYPLGTQDTYDNVSAVMGENRELYEKRHQWEHDFFTQQQN